MKKLLSVALALMMMLSFAALAEETAETVYDPAAIEALMEGEWYTFDDGVEIYLPTGFVELELTEDVLATGTYFAVASEDGAYVITLAWSALEEAITIEDALAELEVTYPGAAMVDNGALQMVCFADAASDVIGYMTVDPAEPGVYTMTFSPMSDADFVTVSAVIVSSWNIVPVEAEAAA